MSVMCGVSATPHDTGKTVGFMLRVTPSVTNRHITTLRPPKGGLCSMCHTSHSVWGVNDTPRLYRYHNIISEVGV